MLLPTLMLGPNVTNLYASRRKKKLQDNQIDWMMLILEKPPKDLGKFQNFRERFPNSKIRDG